MTLLRGSFTLLMMKWTHRQSIFLSLLQQPKSNMSETRWVTPARIHGFDVSFARRPRKRRRKQCRLSGALTFLNLVTVSHMTFLLDKACECDGGWPSGEVFVDSAFC